MWQHIYPLNDIAEHETESIGDCDCEPFVDWGNELVIHYAFDGRDMVEEIGNEMITLPDGSTIKIGNHVYGVQNK